MGTKSLNMHTKIRILQKDIKQQQKHHKINLIFFLNNAGRLRSFSVLLFCCLIIFLTFYPPPHPPPPPPIILHQTPTGLVQSFLFRKDSGLHLFPTDELTGGLLQVSVHNNFCDTRDLLERKGKDGWTDAEINSTSCTANPICAHSRDLTWLLTGDRGGNWFISTPLSPSTRHLHPIAPAASLQSLGFQRFNHFQLFCLGKVHLDFLKADFQRVCSFACLTVCMSTVVSCKTTYPI